MNFTPFFIGFLVTLIFMTFVTSGRVRVKIYDHRAEHDPVELYGTGPWKYKGYGYGIEYQYEPDGSYGREKGYGFVKAYGRDFCRHSKSYLCRPADPNFFSELIKPSEPYWAHPSGDVISDQQQVQSQSTINQQTTNSLWKPNWIRHS